MANFPTRWTKPIVPAIAAAAHIAGDALGDRIDVTGALRECGNGGVLAAITVIHGGTGTFEVDFFFFDNVFQHTADDSPFAPTPGDMLGVGSKLLGVVTVTQSEFKTTSLYAIATHECAFPIETKDASGNIECQMVTRTAFTPVVNGITVRFGLLKD